MPVLSRTARLRLAYEHAAWDDPPIGDGAEAVGWVCQGADLWVVDAFVYAIGVDRYVEQQRWRLLGKELLKYVASDKELADVYTF